MTAVAAAAFAAAVACLIVDAARAGRDRAARRARLTEQLRSPSLGRDGKDQT